MTPPLYTTLLLLLLLSTSSLSATAAFPIQTAKLNRSYQATNRSHNTTLQVLLRRRPSGGGSRPGGSGTRPTRPRPPRPGGAAIAGGAAAGNAAGGDDDDDDDDDSACFPGTALVEVQGRGLVYMSSLRLGDRALVKEGHFSNVFFFGHRVPRGNFPFVTLRTANAALSLSSGHYVYADGHLVSAGSITVGAMLKSADGLGHRVVAVEKVLLEGLYNPHTHHGDIVVDGFRVSCYTTSVQPVLATALLAPLRFFFSLAKVDVTGQRLESGAPSVLLRRIRGGDNVVVAS